MYSGKLGDASGRVGKAPKAPGQPARDGGTEFCTPSRCSRATRSTSLALTASPRCSAQIRASSTRRAIADGAKPGNSAASRWVTVSLALGPVGRDCCGCVPELAHWITACISDLCRRCWTTRYRRSPIPALLCVLSRACDVNPALLLSGRSSWRAVRESRRPAQIITIRGTPEPAYTKALNDTVPVSATSHDRGTYAAPLWRL